MLCADDVQRCIIYCNGKKSSKDKARVTDQSVFLLLTALQEGLGLEFLSFALMIIFKAEQFAAESAFARSKGTTKQKDASSLCSPFAPIPPPPDSNNA